MPARIHVLLPAGATLTIDGQPTRATAADRLFLTPPLEVGQVFYYTLQAKSTRDGNTWTVERRVAVRAGQETKASLNAPYEPDGGLTYYYEPVAAGDGTPPAAFRPAPVHEAPSLPADVGGARDNWKPDFSDPFAVGSEW